MKVSYSYLERQFEHPDALLADVRNLVLRGDFTLGKEVEAFEDKFANFTGMKHAIGVSSGTAALYLGLQAAGVGYGDEVITTPNTFIATVNAIAAVGAKPVFVDVREDYTIDPTLIKDSLSRKTKAIMPVHLTGRPADMQPIMDIARNYGLAVIEDAAQAIDARIEGLHVGQFGDAAGFSFHPLKNLNVWGDAGMIVTNRDDYNVALRELRNQGLKDRDTWNRYGHNLRIASLQALIGKHLIDDTLTLTNRRIENASFYDEQLKGIEGLSIPARSPRNREVFHTYVVQSTKRDALLDHLVTNDIEAKVHYPIPLHLQPAAKHLGYQLGDFPVTERQASQILSLPVHSYLTNTEREYVVEKVREFYK